MARWPTGAPRTADEPRDVLVLRLIPVIAVSSLITV
jgi:hypothetical protein